ncbi:PKD domain-containing protein [Homoserinimonas sp. A520]
MTGPVTLSDLVNFRPAPGVDHMEPNGWMIVGLDTNFYARSAVQVQDGLLLGEPASVRFTPVRYHWTYGDGTRASRSMPGTTWRAQGVDEFDPTPTSHVYTSSGTYYIDLTIDFAAEYRWAGSDWTTIAGTIPVPANRLVATAGGAKTVLVEHECTLNPTGPGC